VAKKMTDGCHCDHLPSNYPNSFLHSPLLRSLLAHEAVVFPINVQGPSSSGDRFNSLYSSTRGSVEMEELPPFPPPPYITELEVVDGSGDEEEYNANSNHTTQERPIQGPSEVVENNSTNENDPEASGTPTLVDILSRLEALEKKQDHISSKMLGYMHRLLLVSQKTVRDMQKLEAFNTDKAHEVQSIHHKLDTFFEPAVASLLQKMDFSHHAIVQSLHNNEDLVCEFRSQMNQLKSLTDKQALGTNLQEFLDSGTISNMLHSLKMVQASHFRREMMSLMKQDVATKKSEKTTTSTQEENEESDIDQLDQPEMHSECLFKNLMNPLLPALSNSVSVNSSTTTNSEETENSPSPTKAPTNVPVEILVFS